MILFPQSITFVSRTTEHRENVEMENDWRTAIKWLCNDNLRFPQATKKVNNYFVRATNGTTIKKTDNDKKFPYFYIILISLSLARSFRFMFEYFCCLHQHLIASSFFPSFIYSYSEYNCVRLSLAHSFRSTSTHAEDGMSEMAKLFFYFIKIASVCN
jgi:hypothetical protein